jgi:hypothetical protein
MMEDQVPSSNIPQEAGNYYQNPEGPRYQNPSDFAAAQQNQPTPNFEEMRRIALDQAIKQVTQQPVPQQAPPGMELSMDGSQYVPQKYPVAPAPAPQVTEQVTEQVRVIRRNLTLAELILIFAIATGSVLGVQGIWAFTTDLLPRIEIRAK